MPKIQIIIDAVNGDVPIEKSLKRLQVLAHDVHNEELERWAENELTGYASEDEVPEYRKTKSLRLIYTGFNRMVQITNQPLPLACLKKETLEAVADVAVKEDILSIEKLAESEPGGYLDLSILAYEVQELSNGGIQCINIRQLIPSSFYRKVLAEVNNRIVKALMMLEDQHGKLDKLGIKISATKSTRGNVAINEALGLPVRIIEKEPLGSKITWKVIVPILTAVGASIITAIIMGALNLP